MPQEIALPPSPQEYIVWTRGEGELAKQMQRLHKRSPEADPSGKSPLTQLKVTQLFSKMLSGVSLSVTANFDTLRQKLLWNLQNNPRQVQGT